MTDSATISPEARRMEAEQCALDLGQIAYAKQAQEDTEEIPTCPHEARTEVQPLAMHTAPTCPTWFPWLMAACIVGIGVVVWCVGCVVSWAWCGLVGVA